jgi:putative DNA primase/helicase
VPEIEAHVDSLRAAGKPDIVILTDVKQRYSLSEDEALACVRRAPRRPADGYRVVLTPYSEIESDFTEWVWDQRVPRAALTLWLGTEGLGKTASGLALGAALTRGELPGCFEGEPVNVALFTTEDDPSRTLSPRLDGAQADRARIFDVKMKRDAYDRGFSLPDDAAFIIEALADADVRFAFIDPLASMLDPKKNSWKDTDVRDALTPLVGGGIEYDVTLMGSLHTNKGNSTDPRQRGMGSAGWRQVARASFLVGLDPEDEAGKQGSARCIAHDKHNLGRWTPTVRFELETADVTIKAQRQEIVRAVLGDECEVRAEEMLAAEQGHERPGQGAESEAFRWLRRQLEDGPKAVNALMEAAEDAGHAWRTIERAKKELGVRSKRVSGAKGWTWDLDDEIPY